MSLTEEQLKKAQQSITTQLEDTQTSDILQQDHVRLASFQNYLSTDSAMTNMAERYYMNKLAPPLGPAPQEATKPKHSKLRQMTMSSRDQRVEELRYEQELQEKAVYDEKKAGRDHVLEEIKKGRESEVAQRNGEYFKKHFSQYGWTGIKWGSSYFSEQVTACKRLESMKILLATHGEKIEAIPALKTVTGHLNKRLALCANAMAQNLKERDGLETLRQSQQEITEDMAQFMADKKEELHLVTQALLREMGTIESITDRYLAGEIMEMDDLKYLARSGMRGALERPQDIKVYVTNENTGDTGFHEADHIYRPKTEKLWKKLTKDEKEALYQYTADSSPVNQALRGYKDNWLPENYLGPENTKKDIPKYEPQIRSALEKSKLEENVQLRRGSDANRLSIMLGIKQEMLAGMTPEQINTYFSGQIIKDPTFFSTSTSEGSSYAGMDVQYKILAQEGTKGIYCEPFSAYGGLIELPHPHEKVQRRWDGKTMPMKKGKLYIKGEAEILLQAGTRFVIEKIERIKSDKYKGFDKDGNFGFKDQYFVYLKTLVPGSVV